MASHGKTTVVQTYRLPPTALMPNSPLPLIHYRSVLTQKRCTPGDVFDLFDMNGWQTQWITRYGPTQASHYHSKAHECMAVLSGTATIRFGVADTDEDPAENTHGSGREQGGVEVEAHAGDVFILPAGTAHKTYNTSPAATFRQLLPGDGHFLDAQDPRETVANVELSGFSMIGAYPVGSTWDFMTGGEQNGHYEDVWATPKPTRDPVFGTASEGLCGLW